MQGFLLKLKPGITKKSLLFVAGSLWTFAGCLLLFKGLRFLFHEHLNLIISLMIGTLGGILFFYIVFYRISGKYISRIHHLSAEKPCLFSFFSWKSYLLMGIMITGGIFVNKLDFLRPHELHVFFIMMSLPLLLSGLRFLHQGCLYNQQTHLYHEQQM